MHPVTGDISVLPSPLHPPSGCNAECTLCAVHSAILCVLPVCFTTLVSGSFLATTSSSNKKHHQNQQHQQQQATAGPYLAISSTSIIRVPKLGPNFPLSRQKCLETPENLDMIYPSQVEAAHIKQLGPIIKSLDRVRVRGRVGVTKLVYQIGFTTFFRSERRENILAASSN